MEYLYQGLTKSIYDHESLRQTLAQHLDLPHIDAVEVEREALDARRKSQIRYVYNLRFTVSQESPRLRALLQRGEIAPFALQALPEAEPQLALPERPVIAGFGPAGMYAGLWLARMGYRPIIYERGEPVAARARSVAALWERGELNPESNLQFGEGGAGTWSDGKLTTGKRSALDRLVLETLVQAGAPNTILFRAKPHIGTDHLRRVVVSMRRQIEELGGEVYFGHKLTQIHVSEGQLVGVTSSGGRLATECLILAIGHSARDTISMLHNAGVAMQAKPFALGTRIEHPAAFVNESQYGADAAEILPAADYKLSYHHEGRGVYTFCMCPGGQVVCASSEVGGQVTNGMSRYARDAAWSNSAIVAAVDPGGRSLTALEAIAYQRELEERVYDAGGGGYVAPAQWASDFVIGRSSTSVPETSYRPGVAPGRLDEALPTAIVPALKAALARFDRAIPGFVDKGVLIGLESRTSSPVRILRDEHCQSVSVSGLYLLGEGSGYAGGIMTCARDALRFARLVKPRG
jgi:uncharacterized FAD-dependent dehydrogenase